MPPRVSLGAFLARARSALTAPAPQRASPLTLVVGNESAGTKNANGPLSLGPLTV
ncbi:hypothetical protein LX36DRAFT_664786 [Colletotrichum falcatum]|nr:hypothetical protein LX36DRAFT_664786 [Colletotrichum falcatum]